MTLEATAEHPFQLADGIGGWVSVSPLNRIRAGTGARPYGFNDNLFFHLSVILRLVRRIQGLSLYGFSQYASSPG
jgi:hypothetical protein